MDSKKKPCIRELSKENLKDVTNPKTKSEILELVSKLFPARLPMRGYPPYRMMPQEY